jgi:hypothetical protein
LLPSGRDVCADRHAHIHDEEHEILQGIGALEIVGSFLFPETRTVTAERPRRVLVTPYYVGSSYGMSAFASF